MTQTVGSWRSEIRSGKDRSRTFRPNYLSFAGTYQCNLTCPHCCVPIEWPDRLDLGTALRFLEEARSCGVEILGFTGGEPFLYPEFVQCLTARAVKLGYRFDKIQTNGVWHRDAAHLESILVPLRDAGFSGKLGISVDKFHGKHTARAAEFCRVARQVFGRDNIVALSYASRAPDLGLEPVHDLARELDAIVDWSAVLHRYLLVSPDFTMVLNWNHLAAVERAENLRGSWDGTWFEEDYCEGPGQALIVTPRGEVKPCCGFASDLDQLTIGNIHTDRVSDIITRAREHPYVGKVFRDGLLAIRDEILARDPAALPEATSNHCFFCWYVLTRGLAGAAGAEQNRMSLPLVSAPAPQGTSTALRMRFDGRTVFVGHDLPARGSHDRGEVFSIRIVGRDVVQPPAEPLGWEAYQRWIDGLRNAGYTLTTQRTEAGCGTGCGSAR